jgi:hypothetical protein
VEVVHQTTRNLRDGLVLGHSPILCTENSMTCEGSLILRAETRSRRAGRPG